MAERQFGRLIRCELPVWPGQDANMTPRFGGQAIIGTDRGRRFRWTMSNLA
jgi:hypothetical protein